MQGLIVSLIVTAATAYAAWLLMPQSTRRWLIGRLMAIAPSRRAWLARLEAGAETGGCSSCKGCSADSRASSALGQAKIELRRRVRN
jgi:hypothetical protein